MGQRFYSSPMNPEWLKGPTKCHAVWMIEYFFRATESHSVYTGPIGLLLDQVPALPIPHH